MVKKINKSMHAVKGVCCFHSETGTEGGDWAFQEARYIRKNVHRGWCKKCGRILKKNGGKFEFVGHSKPISDCQNNAHDDVGDIYDYKGLHILKDGDILKIYSKDNPEKIVWSGKIKLRILPLFKENAFGWWIHADQKGMNREVWARYFFKNYPATLRVCKEAYNAQ